MTPIPIIPKEILLPPLVRDVKRIVYYYLIVYHENVINPGFNARGNNKWQPHNIASGKMATN